MRRFPFHHVDVFTDTPLSGNPLAVFPEADGLTDGEMQAIARELRLSETTFVLPPTDPEAAYRVRIFTPARELPFAGHPLIGTPWVMAQLGKVPPGALGGPRIDLRQQVAIGTLPVTLETEPAGEESGAGLRIARVVMTQGEPRHGPELAAADAAAVEAALRLPTGAVGRLGLPPQVVSTGIAHLLVPLRSTGEVAALAPDLEAVKPLTERSGTVGVYVFALEPSPAGATGVTARARLFAPAHGVAEDPATGSAAGCLGAYLAARGRLPEGRLRIRQGVEIGQPSRLEVEVEDGGRPGAAVVRVAGRVVPLATGTLVLP